MEQLFIDLPKQTSIDKQNDYLHVISSNGDDKVMSIYDFFGMVVDGEFIVRKTDGSISFISHQTPPYALRNSLPRFKNLGSVFTTAQATAIANKTFKDMFLGDYWEFSGGFKPRIVDFGYWLDTGDTPCTTPHIVVVPDSGLYSTKMNETNTTEGGYIGSAMAMASASSTGIPYIMNARTKFQETFGASHLLAHRELFANAVTNGKPSSCVWCNNDIALMNEPMVFGTHYFAPANDGTTVPYLHTIDKIQLALFALCPELIATGKAYWLRDVVSQIQFSNVSGAGYPDYNTASGERDVRPAVGIK